MNSPQPEQTSYCPPTPTTTSSRGESIAPSPSTLRREPGPIRRRLPQILFVATCLTTFLAGSGLIDTGLWFVCYLAENLIRHLAIPPNLGLVIVQLWAELPTACVRGLAYAACVMTILICHEMGHYIQARRYGVPASLPFFIPMPFGPIGTMGAVIGMRPGVGDRRAIFDIGITGPLAGLVPTLIFCVLGLWNTTLVPVSKGNIHYGEPLLMQLLVWFRFGSRPEGIDVALNPMLFAAWVGLLITSLNLIPIGQLDGGHILYALLRKKAHRVASWLLNGAAVAVIFMFLRYGYPVWILMVVLLMVMGPNHPPTADDNVPLGPMRVVLGWLTLAFILVGFTPMPI